MGRLTNIALYNSALFILNSLNKLYVLILEKKLLDYCRWKRKENYSPIAHASYERSIVWEKKWGYFHIQPYIFHWSLAMDALQGMEIINSQGRLFRFLKIMRKKTLWQKNSN